MSYKIILISLFFLISCSQEKPLKDEANSSGPDLTTIENLESKMFEATASSEAILFEIGPIFTSSGRQVGNADIFSLTSSISGLTIGQTNENLASFGSEKDVSASADGKIRFKAQLPTASSVYNISIKAKTYSSSTGLIYFQVKPASIVNLSDVTSSVFRDEAPYNGLKDPNETFSVVNGVSTLVRIGPVKDEFGNNVASGSLDVAILNGYFQDIKTPEGENSALGTVDVRSGFANINVISLDITQPVKILATLGGYLSDPVKVDQIRNPPSSGVPFPFISKDLSIINSEITIVGDEDFGVVFIGESKTKSYLLQNFGNTPLTSIVVAVSPPFVVDSGSCVGLSRLEPQQSCSVNIRYLAEFRTYNTGAITINGQYRGSPLPEQSKMILVQAAFPSNITIDLEGNLLTFENQPVGDVVTKTFTVVNTGDVDAENLHFVNPPPHPGKLEGYFNFRSLPSTIPNDDISMGEHCGQTLPPQKKCKIYVDYLPRDKVGPEILAGSLLFDNRDPVTLFVQGRSYVNNFERTITVSSIKYQIRKDEIETVGVVVGPIRDIYGAVVPDQNIEVQLYKDETSPAGAVERIYLGNVSSPNLIIGGPLNTHILRTDSEGYANFNVKSRFQDTVGQFIIDARIVDLDGNILTQGSAGYDFVGTKLLFDTDLINFADAVIGKSYEKTVTLKNEGSLSAGNVQVAFETPDLFEISDEGDCGGIVDGSKNLAVNESCSFTISVEAPSRNSFLDQLIITSSTIGNKIPSSVFARGISPARIVSENGLFVGTHIINGDPLETSITFANVGDETAKNFQAFAVDQGSSFQFEFTCTNLLPGRSCRLDVSYDPQSIPSPILNTEIVVLAVGQLAEFATEIRIPIQIYHSSLKFTSTEPGINLNKCYELRVQGFQVSNGNLNFSEDIPLALRSTGAGQFFSDLNCAFPVTSVVMPANTYLTPKFYYKPTVAGNQILFAESSELSSAVKSFEIYKNPVDIEIRFGDAQNGLTDRLLAERLAVKAIDEDGKGIPNIPISVTILKEIAKEPQRIQNPEFNTGIANWEVTAGIVEWFRGFGGTIRLSSLTSVAQTRSSSVGLILGQNYYLGVKVSESTGVPASANLIVNIEDTLSGAVLESFEIEGKRTKIFKYTATSENVRVRLKTKSFAPGTRVYVDSVFFTADLAPAAASPVQYGTVISPSPINTDFDGPGVASTLYQTPSAPTLIAIKFNSTYPSLSNREVIFSVNIEFPTNITGLLGDLTVNPTSGPLLVKNGANNLSQLQDISGYNWNATSKILTLPAGRVYDFQNITIDTGTTVKFAPPASGLEHVWTELYAKQNCSINGRIETKGFQKPNANQKDYIKYGLDGEELKTTIADYATHGKGGNGGAGGYRLRVRSRTCSYICVKGCSWSCNKYSGHSFSGGFNAILGAFTGENGTAYLGGKGAAGRSGKDSNPTSSTAVYPAQTNGGLGGARGKDGGLLFLHCFNSLVGTGSIDARGDNGTAGGNGQSGSLQYNSEYCGSYSPTNGGTRECIRLDSFSQMSGGAGGGAAGNGGHGGALVVKSKALPTTVIYQKTAGSPGSAGAGGSSAQGYNNGASGTTGVSGTAGECKIIDPNTQIVSDC